MKNYRNLDVLNAADLVADEIHRLIESATPRLLHARQLSDSSQAISANISEAFGRGKDGGRNQSLRVARGGTEETIRHLRTNYQSKRIPGNAFWTPRNRLVTISKMIASIART